MAKERLAGRFLKSLPFVGDIAGAGFELMDPTESLTKNIKDAAIIGGGGFIGSLATGGLDAVPSLANLAVDLAGAATGNKQIVALGQRLDYVDPLSYLQAASDKVHYGKSLGLNLDNRMARVAALNPELVKRQQQAQKAARPAPTAYETGSDNPKIGVEQAPLRGGGQEAPNPLTSVKQRIAITPDTIDQLEAALEQMAFVNQVAGMYAKSAAK